jgi:hypothetical protein
MAEPLSITANILAVAMTGFKLAQGLYQLADGIGSAGKEVRVYADEIDALSKLLQLIRIHIESAPAEFSYERTLLRDILDACGRILGQIGRIQISLTPLMDRFRSSESKMKALSVRIQWIFCCKDKLLFYLAALRGQHRLLDTTLALMVLQKPKDRSSENLK